MNIKLGDIVEKSFSEEGDEINGRYHRYASQLGRGGYKVVYRAWDTVDSVDVAWNCVDLDRLPSNTEKNKIFREVTMLQLLKHENILGIRHSWQNKQLNQLIFITDLISSGTLRKFIQERMINLGTIKKWCIQILHALNYLHEQTPSIIHRDIKCDNIFIDGASGKVIIGDLGLSTQTNNITVNKGLSIVGTPEFMAPELYEENYDEKVDIYAFGMCVLEMITKKYPYEECDNPVQVYKKVINNDLPDSLNTIRQPSVKSFIEFCIEKYPYKRPTALECLSHPFFNTSRLDRINVDNFVSSNVDLDVIHEDKPSSPIIIKNNKNNNKRINKTNKIIKNFKNNKSNTNYNNLKTTDQELLSILPFVYDVKTKIIDNGIDVRLKVNDGGTKGPRKVNFQYNPDVESPDEVVGELVLALKLDPKRKDEILNAMEAEIKKEKLKLEKLKITMNNNDINNNINKDNDNQINSNNDNSNNNNNNKLTPLKQDNMKLLKPESLSTSSPKHFTYNPTRKTNRSNIANKNKQQIVNTQNRNIEKKSLSSYVEKETKPHPKRLVSDPINKNEIEISQTNRYLDENNENDDNIITNTNNSEMNQQTNKQMNQQIGNKSIIPSISNSSLNQPINQPINSHQFQQIHQPIYSNVHMNGNFVMPPSNQDQRQQAYQNPMQNPMQNQISTQIQTIPPIVPPINNYMPHQLVYMPTQQNPSSFVMLNPNISPPSVSQSRYTGYNPTSYSEPPTSNQQSLPQNNQNIKQSSLMVGNSLRSAPTDQIETFKTTIIKNSNTNQSSHTITSENDNNTSSDSYQNSTRDIKYRSAPNTPQISPKENDRHNNTNNNLFKSKLPKLQESISDNSLSRKKRSDKLKNHSHSNTIDLPLHSDIELISSPEPIKEHRKSSTAPITSIEASNVVNDNFQSNKKHKIEELLLLEINNKDIDDYKTVQSIQNKINYINNCIQKIKASEKDFKYSQAKHKLQLSSFEVQSENLKESKILSNVVSKLKELDEMSRKLKEKLKNFNKTSNNIQCKQIDRTFSDCSESSNKSNKSNKTNKSTKSSNMSNTDNNKQNNLNDSKIVSPREEDINFSNKLPISRPTIDENELSPKPINTLFRINSKEDTPIKATETNVSNNSSLDYNDILPMRVQNIVQSTMSSILSNVNNSSEILKILPSIISEFPQKLDLNSSKIRIESSYCFEGVYDEINDKLQQYRNKLIGEYESYLKDEEELVILTLHQYYGRSNFKEQLLKRKELSKKRLLSIKKQLEIKYKDIIDMQTEYLKLSCRLAERRVDDEKMAIPNFSNDIEYNNIKSQQTNIFHDRLKNFKDKQLSEYNMYQDEQMKIYQLKLENIRRNIMFSKLAIKKNQNSINNTNTNTNNISKESNNIPSNQTNYVIFQQPQSQNQIVGIVQPPQNNQINQLNTMNQLNQLKQLNQPIYVLNTVPQLPQLPHSSHHYSQNNPSVQATMLPPNNNHNRYNSVPVVIQTQQAPISHIQTQQIYNNGYYSQYPLQQISVTNPNSRPPSRPPSEKFTPPNERQSIQSINSIPSQSQSVQNIANVELMSQQQHTLPFVGGVTNIRNNSNRRTPVHQINSNVRRINNTNNENINNTNNSLPNKSTNFMNQSSNEDMTVID